VESTLAQKTRDIRECVAERIGANRFRTWFGENAEFHLSDDECLDVTVDNPFVGQWISGNFLADLRCATQQVLGAEGNVDVRVIQRGAAERAPDPQPEISRPPQRRRPARSSRDTRFRGSLDTFVVGDGNRLAFATATQLARNPAQACKLTVLHSNCGLGKTHLLHGICNSVRDLHPTLDWRYVSGEEFTNEFIYAVKGGHIDRFRAQFRDLDLLIIDDIHFLRGKKATQDEFLHTFDAIDASGMAVVLSSDRHPRTIATLSEPLVNRLISGIVIEIHPPEFATRCEILRRRTQTLKRSLSDAVVQFVATHITRNVRELEGAVHRLVAIASLTREPITVDLARQALSDCIQDRPVVGPREIEAEVAGYFTVPAERIRSKSRDRTVSLARAVTMYLVRKHSTLSFPEIGREFGNKNHSTVLMATQRIERQIREQAAVKWKCLTGPKSAPIRLILESLEAELFPTA
jgi:chromosomal replication initiator protein